MSQLSPDKRCEVESDDAIRARYEAWAGRMNLSLKRKGGGYSGPYTDWCWQAFYCGTRTAFIPSHALPKTHEATKLLRAAGELLNGSIRMGVFSLEKDSLADRLGKRIDKFLDTPGGLNRDVSAGTSHSEPDGSATKPAISSSQDGASQGAAPILLSTPSTTPRSSEAAQVARLLGKGVRKWHRLKEDKGDTEYHIVKDVLQNWPVIEAALTASVASATPCIADEQRKRGLTPEMVAEHYPQTQHQPDECEICHFVFKIAEEALRRPDGGKQT